MFTDPDSILLYVLNWQTLHATGSVSFQLGWIRSTAPTILLKQHDVAAWQRIRQLEGKRHTDRDREDKLYLRAYGYIKKTLTVASQTRWQNSRACMFKPKKWNVQRTPPPQVIPAGLCLLLQKWLPNLTEELHLPSLKLFSSSGLATDTAKKK